MEDMPVGDSVPPLSAIWRMREPRTQVCSVCNQAIGSGAIIRTFKIVSSDSEAHGLGCEFVAAFGHKFVLIHRHFQCLQASKANYITISHVWDSRVSRTQNEGSASFDDTSDGAVAISRLVFREAIELYQGIHRRAGDNFEIWHDYISVPQWETEVKVDILLRIPDIYRHSHFTAVYWHEVELSDVQTLRGSEASGSSERLGAIIRICQSRWYRRVWTAMEFIRSQKVRVMLKGHHLCDNGDDLFMASLSVAWEEEGKNIGDVFELEKQAGINRNVLPWQIQGLGDLRESQSRDFGLAFERLALRGCATPLDFYYAMLGLVGFELRLLPDPRMAGQQIVEQCLKNQDYSPLLMVPDIDNAGSRKFYGFNDKLSWGLGSQLEKARHALEVGRHKVKFSAQLAGQVQLLETSELVPYRRDPVHGFTQPARIALAKLGTEVEAFVIGLTLRLFATNPYAVLRRLRRNGRYDNVQKSLKMLAACTDSWPEEVVVRLTEDLGLLDVSIHSDRQPEDSKKIPSFSSASPTPWSPMTYYMMQGRSHHVDDRSALIGMRCPSCKQILLTRAGVWASHGDAQDAKCYRIPGLHYESSLPDGIGIIVKNGRIIGRFIFCVPCCRDPVVETVELDVPTVPTPLINNFPYGEGLVFQNEASGQFPVKFDEL